MSRIMTVVEYEVKPQHRNAFIEIAKGHAARSRAQDGCQQFDVLLATEDANRILLVEAWRDEAALDGASPQPDDGAGARDPPGLGGQPQGYALHRRLNPTTWVRISAMVGGDDIAIGHCDRIKPPGW